MYIIQCGDSEYYKIGIAENTLERLAGLQTGCPYKLHLILTCGFTSRSAARTAEAQTHRSLDYHLVRGEWFELPTKRLNELKQNMVICGV
jgi:hypothetical protein